MTQTTKPGPESLSQSESTGDKHLKGHPLRDEPRKLDDPSLFINRELSWLEFNQRVLNEARDTTVPLLERLKFLAITTSNLDEFFMVRVAGLLEQVSEGIEQAPADGLPPHVQLDLVARRSASMLDEMYAALQTELLPELEAAGVRLMMPKDLSKPRRKRLRRYFREQVLPILTPLAIDPGHPFPHVRNKSLNLVASISGTRDTASPAFAIVQVPRVIPRLVPVRTDDDGHAFILLENVIAAHLDELFPGFRTVGAWPFRVIRNSDLDLDEEEAVDLLASVREEVRRRDHGNAVRLTVSSAASAAALELLTDALHLDPKFVFPVDGPLALTDLLALSRPFVGTPAEAKLKDPAFSPETLPPFRDTDDIFEAIAKQDVLLHHPYESFDPVVQFVEAASTDPNVLAIKQTMYRTSGDSPIVTALMRAAENGKQVAALVEIKARFDEENNIQWARRLENAGVHVVYGLLGLKTHCKVSLVVRRENNKIRRYVHLGTGNYNPNTAKLYTDLSLFTARAEIGRDATSLFNLLTSCTAPTEWHRLIVAPLGLFEGVLGMIEREATAARAGRPAKIIAKMNSLVDPDVIAALYGASQAGVEIDLIVRGVCCLRPGVPGISENIRVRSIVDRFLEHHRIFFFEANGARELYASSADWMPRNFHRRVEVLFPIDSEQLKARVLDEVLGAALRDNVKASMLDQGGSYFRPRHKKKQPRVRSQDYFLDKARKAAAKADAQEKLERPFVVRPVRIRPTNEGVVEPSESDS